MPRRQLSWILPLLIALGLGWQSMRPDPTIADSAVTIRPTSQPLLPQRSPTRFPTLAAARQGQAITLSFEDQQKVLLLESLDLLSDSFRISLGNTGPSKLPRPEVFTGWAMDPTGNALPMQATLAFVGDQGLGTWITSEGTTWQFQWKLDSTNVTLTEILAPLYESTLEDATCRLQEIGGHERTAKVLNGELAIAAQGGLEPATGEPSKYVDAIPSSEAYALSLKDLDVMLVLDQSATGPNESESLALLASQWLATTANVATIYENQLGIRLQLQEMILIPEDPAFTDIPSSNVLPDFRTWINEARPRSEYPWQAAFKIGAGLRAQDLGLAFVGALGRSDSIGVIRANTGWGTLAHELGHSLGADHTMGGMMNAQANDGGDRDFFTEVTGTVGRTAAWQIYDHSESLLTGAASMRHPEEMPFAKNDFRVIPPSTTYTFDPRSNDLRSVRFGRHNGSLSIDSVGTLRPSDAGALTHDGGQLTFHPSESYSGPVWFSYTLRGSLGNDSQGWLHKGDVTLLVDDQPPSEILEIAPGEVRTFSAPSAFGSITQPRDATVHRLIDDDHLLIRVRADAVGTDAFTIGSDTFTIRYTEAQLATQPDAYWHHSKFGTLAMRPLANDTASIGSAGTEVSVGLDGEQLPDVPRKLRLISATNQSPDKGTLTIVTAPSLDNEIPTGELHFTPTPDAQGTVSLSYMVRGPSGATAPETITIYLTGDTQTLLSSGGAVRYFVPRTPSDADDWFSLALNDESWSSGSIPIGYEDGRGYENVIQTDVGSQMVNINSTIYARIPFDLTETDQISQLKLRMRMDDGFVAYLNGKEILRDNTPDIITWISSAILGREADAFVDFDITETRSLLRPGDNLLAIHGMNALPDSSDFLIMPELIALTLPQIAQITSPEKDSISVPINTGIVFKQESIPKEEAGLNITEPISSHWQIIEAPSSAVMQAQALPNGDFPVYFIRPGTYRIRLTATDASGLQTHEERTVRVGESRSYDQAADTIILTESSEEVLSTTLAASITSETPWITPEIRWTTLAGPADASIDDEKGLTTRVTFPRAGRYTLRFEATHSDLTLFQDADIDVLTEEQLLIGDGSPSRFTSSVPEPSWQLPGFDDSLWSEGGQGLGYDLGGGFTPYIDTEVESEMRFLRTSLFVRYPFQLGNAASIHDLQLSLRMDDGGVIYLNGQEVYRQSAPLYGLSIDSTALRSAPETDFDDPTPIDLTEFRHALRQGENVLAIHGLNLAASSSDFLVEPTLRAKLGQGNGLPANLTLKTMLDYALGPQAPSFQFEEDQITVEHQELRELGVAGGRTSVEISQDLEHWTPWVSHSRNIESGMLEDYDTITLTGPRTGSQRYLRIKVSF